MTYDGVPTNFPEWWAVYSATHDPELFVIGGTVWLACYAAWHCAQWVASQQTAREHD